MMWAASKNKHETLVAQLYKLIQTCMYHEECDEKLIMKLLTNMRNYAIEVRGVEVRGVPVGEGRCGLGFCHRHLLPAAYASLYPPRLRRQAAPSCELPAPPVWCALCYTYMHQSCCNGDRLMLAPAH